MNLLPAFISVFGVLLLYHFVSRKPPVEITFEQLEQLLGSEVINFTQVRLFHVNNTLTTLNRTWELLEDLDNHWIMTTILRDRHAIQGPILFQYVRICDYLNSEQYRADWRKLGMESNHPQPPRSNVKLCPFPKGHYHLRNLRLSRNLYGGILDKGQYQMEVCPSENGIVKVALVLSFSVRQVSRGYRIF
ncbi:uncharacterized protein LOC129728045 [Wyeomyia smithii]|uniref:uncharacterized protein LOC129728045 n=1 Tax=Wyeomyia smithii TaxID=174621 RepID=UPI00246808FD|nr:uncharacterized protein LOC129728045 [Wyeomyia smithii]